MVLDGYWMDIGQPKDFITGISLHPRFFLFGLYEHLVYCLAIISRISNSFFILKSVSTLYFQAPHCISTIWSKRIPRPFQKENTFPRRERQSLWCVYLIQSPTPPSLPSIIFSFSYFGFHTASNCQDRRRLLLRSECHYRPQCGSGRRSPLSSLSSSPTMPHPSLSTLPFPSLYYFLVISLSFLQEFVWSTQSLWRDASSNQIPTFRTPLLAGGPLSGDG